MLVSAQVNAVIVNDKNWLQLTTTTGYAWNDLDAIFGTATGQCDVVGCMLGGNIDLTGYVWASPEEVVSMWNIITGRSDSIDYPNYDQELAFVPGKGDLLTALFNPTRLDVGLEYIAGYTRYQISSPYVAGLYLYDWANPYSKDVLGYEVHYVATNRTSNIGHWLYKPHPVPIPAAAWLFGSGLIGLASLARRKKAT